MIEANEFRNWLDNSVTKEILKTLQDRREFYVNRVLDGIPEAATNFLITFGEHIGHINAYDELLNITFSDLEE